jgi:predicted O-methyltransferase YrrM
MKREELLKYVQGFTYGGMSERELGCLYDFCLNNKVLELGSMVGMSSYVIASVAEHLDCVDLWSDNQDHLKHDPRQAQVYKIYGSQLNMFAEFNRNCKEFIESGKITMYRGNTMDMANSFEDESFDIVFIDADHSYEGFNRDFELYYNKPRPGGLFMFHDYDDDMWTGIKKVCDEKVIAGKIQIVEKRERVAVFRK